MNVQVGILAIGNEVVEGQITNRNAAWLSQEIDKLGAKSLFHISCRDKKDEIHAALNFLSQKCHLILVSGGLGPTRDDCTRESLSDWVGSPLETHAESWKIIESKLTQRQVTIRDGHKNQALIPKGANILANTTGVAPGFFIKANPCFLASLPGPPNELKPMFTNELKPLIEQHLSPRPSEKLYTWICLGAPESEIAHIVESLLGNQYEVGFRLHKPYVEVKVWVPLDVDIQSLKPFQILEEKLKPFIVDSSIENIRKNFHKKLENYKKVFVVDHLSSGLFLDKLKETTWSPHIRYQSFEHQSFRFFNEDEVLSLLKTMPVGNEDMMISLFPKTESSGIITFNGSVLSVDLPKSIPIRSKLGQLYIIEKCFHEWNKSG